MAAGPSSCPSSITSTISTSLVEQPSVSSWTRRQEKSFENALAVHGQDSPDRWECIAALVPGKDASSVKDHYDLLVEDVDGIEAGRIPLPPYLFSSPSTVDGAAEPLVASGESSSVRKGGSLNAGQSPAAGATSNGTCGNGKGTSSKSSDQERRKGIPWTEEEHRNLPSSTDVKSLSAASNLSSHAYTKLFKIIVEKRISIWNRAVFQGL
eukprot:c25902_g2_i2 orf=237-866(+)